MGATLTEVPQRGAPPVVPAGTTIEVTWGETPRAYSGIARVERGSDSSGLRLALERVSVVAGRLEELQRPQVCAHASIEQRPRASNTASNAILPLGTQLRLTLTHARGMILATGIPAIVVTV